MSIKHMLIILVSCRLSRIIIIKDELGLLLETPRLSVEKQILKLYFDKSGLSVKNQTLLLACRSKIVCQESKINRI